jgi:hypothetical protein
VQLYSRLCSFVKKEKLESPSGLAATVVAAAAKTAASETGPLLHNDLATVGWIRVRLQRLTTQVRSEQASEV